MGVQGLHIQHPCGLQRSPTRSPSSFWGHTPPVRPGPFLGLVFMNSTHFEVKPDQSFGAERQFSNVDTNSSE